MLKTLAALIVMCGVAFSQDAPPNEPTQPPASDQRGADKIPFTVKVLPADNAKEQADKAEHDRQEKAVIDEKLAFETQRIADYTNRLGWFTLMLFCAAVGQIALFWVQLRYMGSDIRRARDAFIAANRPKLIVRDVIVWQPSTFESTFSGDFEGFKEGEKLTGHLVIVNIGGTPAKIEFIDKIAFWTKTRLPLRRPYDGRAVERVDPPIIVPAGEGRQIVSISCARPMGPEAKDVTTRQDGWRLYIMGWIRYRDDLGVQTHMKFCREWQYPDERFRAVSDDHYESEC